MPALDQILSRTPRVDHIIIETSGLALPKPLVQAFQWPSVKSRVTVDGVVAVVDGAALAAGKVASDLDALAAQRAGDESLDHDDPVEEVFEDQVACADLIILSKSDLTRRCRQRPRQCGASASMSARARQDRSDRERQGRCVAAARPRPRRRGRYREPQDAITTAWAITSMTTSTVSSSTSLRSLNPDDLAKRVATAAEEENVLRVKGFVEVGGKPMRLLVQAVGPRVNHYYDRAWTAEDDRRSRLVVIGLKGLNRQAIEKILVG